MILRSPGEIISTRPTLKKVLDEKEIICSFCKSGEFELECHSERSEESTLRGSLRKMLIAEPSLPTLKKASEGKILRYFHTSNTEESVGRENI